MFLEAVDGRLALCNESAVSPSNYEVQVPYYYYYYTKRPGLACNATGEKLGDDLKPEPNTNNVPVLC